MGEYISPSDSTKECEFWPIALIAHGLSGNVIVKREFVININHA